MSTKYIIYWDAGYGQTAELVEVESKQEADNEAYMAWREEVESNAIYGALDFNEENCEEYGIDFDEE